MDIMEGATATFTERHFSVGTLDISLSIALLSISIPVARDTCVEPRYCARRTFFGSSIGVGNDWAKKSTHKEHFQFLQFIESIRTQIKNKLECP